MPRRCSGSLPPRRRGPVALLLVVLALACAGSGRSTASFHNTETRGFSATLHQGPSAAGAGYVRGSITIVKGKPAATFKWAFSGYRPTQRLRVLWIAYDSDRHVVIRLCGPCASGASGVATARTPTPWFAAKRTLGTIPPLVAIAELESGARVWGWLAKGSFRAYVT